VHIRQRKWWFLIIYNVERSIRGFQMFLLAFEINEISMKLILLTIGY